MQVPRRRSATIHTSTQKRIQQIARIDHRLLKIELKSAKSTDPATILTSYEPHKGYKHEIRNQHWRKLGQVSRHIPEKRLVLWLDDANGEICHRDKTSPEIAKIIGTNTTAETAEKEMGEHSEKYLYSMT